MLEPNRNYVIEKDGSIHKMLYSGDADWEEKATTSVQEIRAKAIDELVEEAMKRFTYFDLIHGYPTVTDCKVILRDVAEQLKGGAV